MSPGTTRHAVTWHVCTPVVMKCPGRQEPVWRPPQTSAWGLCPPGVQCPGVLLHTHFIYTYQNREPSMTSQSGLLGPKEQQPCQGVRRLWCALALGFPSLGRKVGQ